MSSHQTLGTAPYASAHTAALDQQRWGIGAVILSQLLFGVVYVYGNWLAPLTGTQVFLWRMVMMWLCLIVFVLFSGQFVDIRRQLTQIFTQQNPQYLSRSKLWLWLLLPTPIFASQLWLFMWAPVNGQGVQVAMGYFLFPLVMVVIGALRGERLGRLEWVAVLLAAVGAGSEVVRTGQISLATLWVCVGYPIYYLLRRLQGLRPLTALMLDVTLIAPACLIALAIQTDMWAVLNDGITLLKIIGLGVVSILAFGLNLSANRSLNTSVFGMLSYLEPAVLFVLAIMVLGQHFEWAMLGSFGLIWLAIICLIVSQWYSLTTKRSAQP